MLSYVEKVEVEKNSALIPYILYIYNNPKYKEIVGDFGETQKK